eukprot:7357828-Alexandrium_andersonii.AAC.1
MLRPPVRRARRGRWPVLLATTLRSRCPIGTSSSQSLVLAGRESASLRTVSYTHLRAHETSAHL